MHNQHFPCLRGTILLTQMSYHWRLNSFKGTDRGLGALSYFSRIIIKHCPEILSLPQRCIDQSAWILTWIQAFDIKSLYGIYICMLLDFWTIKTTIKAAPRREISKVYCTFKLPYNLKLERRRKRERKKKDKSWKTYAVRSTITKWCADHSKSKSNQSITFVLI